MLNAHPYLEQPRIRLSVSLAQICNFFISSASTRQRVTTAQAVAKRDDCISTITLANPSSLPRAATLCLLYDKKLSKTLAHHIDFLRHIFHLKSIITHVIVRATIPAKRVGSDAYECVGMEIANETSDELVEARELLVRMEAVDWDMTYVLTMQD